MFRGLNFRKVEYSFPGLSEPHPKGWAKFFRERSEQTNLAEKTQVSKNLDFKSRSGGDENRNTLTLPKRGSASFGGVVWEVAKKVL